MVDLRSASDIVLKVKDWLTDWENLDKEVQSIIEEATHFDMRIPPMPAYSEVGEEMENIRMQWKEFQT